jgi:hypothetical protein
VQHVGHHDIDAEDGGAGALGLAVEPRQRLADQRELSAILEVRRRVERQLRGVGRQRAVGPTLSIGADHESFLGAALIGRDLPVVGGGADQHPARGSARGPQAGIEDSGRHRSALLLDGGLVLEGDLVGLTAGHEADFHPLPIGVELVGQDLRQHGVGTLPHFRLRQAERDVAARGDQDPVGDFVIGTRLGGLAAQRCNGERNQQRGGPGKQKAARQSERHRASLMQFVPAIT